MAKSGEVMRKKGPMVSVGSGDWLGSVLVGAERLQNLSRQRLLNFAVAGNRFNYARSRIDPQGVGTPFTL